MLCFKFVYIFSILLDLLCGQFDKIVRALTFFLCVLGLLNFISNLYRQGESLLLSKEAQQIANDEQNARLHEDPWKGRIAKYVADKESVVMDDIFIHVLGMTDPRTWNRSHETRVGTTLCQLGWQKRRRIRIW